MSYPSPYDALVVDDDPLVLMTLCMFLEELGFDCTSAQSGDEAAGMLAEIAPKTSMLVTDIDMPGTLDGIALATKVSERYSWIDTVVVSGRVTPAKGELPDNATFLPKPFSMSMLERHLQLRLPVDKLPGGMRRSQDR